MQTAQEQQQQLRNEIRQTIRDATDAARDARASGQNGPTVIVRPPTPPTPPNFSYSGDGGFNNRNDIPPQAVDMAIGFFIMCAVIVIGWPLARAFGKRIERRAAEPVAMSPQLADQLQRIEQAVDAMSIEVERISESQRFMAKIQSQNAERVPLPADRG